MSTVARYTGAVNTDNSGRIISNDYQTPAYATPLAPVLKAAYTLIKPAALTGALTINLAAPVTYPDNDVAPFVGDEVEFLLQSDATSRTVTFGTNMAPTAATFAVTTAKFGSVKFKFNGTVWQETARAITA